MQQQSQNFCKQSWAMGCCRGWEGEKGRVIHGRSLSMTLAVVLISTVWKTSLFNKLKFPSVVWNVKQVTQSWLLGASRPGGYPGTLELWKPQTGTDQDKPFGKADKVGLESSSTFCCSAGFPRDRKCWIWKCRWGKGRTRRKKPMEKL